MWYLTEEKEPAPGEPAKPSARYWLGGVAAQGRTIGRKHVDIRLKASSVSRTHARITVLKAAFYSPAAVAGRRRHHSTSVSVQDSSAYGTFLKYPPGHASNRTEVAIGHHRRLDKDTPTEVSEGALLAFGAPSAWWRLGWYSIVVMPSRLTAVESSRLSTIAGITSLEVVDAWAQDVTHLVTPQCITASFKFLMALAEGKHIVSMAWCEALRHTVSEACRAITEAPNEVAAVVAATLGDEKLFAPPFSAADQAAFSADELASAFEPAVKKRRSALFEGVAFVFTREERRSRWAAIIEAIGGTAVLPQALASPSRYARVVYVQGEQSGFKRQQEPIDTSGRPYLPESAVIAAILRADLSSLDTAASATKVATAEVTDVATPGPLDESDGDSDASEPGEPVDKQVTRQASAGEGQIGNVVVAPSTPLSTPDASRGTNAQSAARKRARVNSDGVSRSVAKELSSGIPTSIVAENGTSVTPSKFNNDADNNDVNEREFFSVDDIVPSAVQPTVQGASAGMSSRHDVRPFRRKKLPSGNPIPLKRVRYQREEAGFYEGSGTVAEPRMRERETPGDSDARVVDSEEE